jgi:glycosyltransferase involved in cell wall biosynthesis
VKIVLVGPLPPPPSGQAVSFSMLVNFVQSKHKVVKVVDIASNVNPTTSPFVRTLFRSIEYIRIMICFFYYILGGADRVYLTIAQSPLGFWRDYFFIMVASSLGIPVIVHLKGGNYKGFFESSSAIKKLFIKSALIRVRTIIVLSERLLETFDFDQRLTKKLQVIKNGFIGSEPAPPLNVENVKPLHVVFLSNLILSKGYLKLIDAVKMLIDEGEDVKLTMAGAFMPSVDDDINLRGDKARSRKDLMEYIGSGYDISYAGTLDGEAKWELLKKSHVMVLPTSYIYEGQPVSIIEGLAYGLPIVSTNYKAIPDMVSSLNGILLSKSNSQEIANAIRVFFDVELLNKMRQQSYELYREEFTQSYHLNTLLGCITDIGAA